MEDMWEKLRPFIGCTADDDNGDMVMYKLVYYYTTYIKLFLLVLIYQTRLSVMLKTPKIASEWMYCHMYIFVFQKSINLMSDNTWHFK